MHLVILAAAAALATPPAPPFVAWLTVDTAYVRVRADANAPAVGLLRRGDTVRVSGCEPACDARGAWALLGEDGAIRLSLLSTEPRPDPAVGVSAEARYVWGKVRRKTSVRAEPADDARRLRQHVAGQVLAFRDAPDVVTSAWLVRPEGGYVAAADVTLHVPSPLVGLRDPELPLAFTVRATAPVVPRGEVAVPVVKYRRLHPEAFEARNKLRTAEGLFDRRDVRVAFLRPRPKGVAADAKWVHVDVAEQVLVAYEGDRPVLATLVSTGVNDARRRTPEGLFPVWLKTIHHRMTGTPEDPYEVDEVPYSLFFREGFALHGAFWHDGFGSPRSHGCVNLAMADAEWLFNWAPPLLPDGWHSTMPLLAKRPTLQVFVERAKAGVLPTPRE